TRSPNTYVKSSSAFSERWSETQPPIPFWSISRILVMMPLAHENPHSSSSSAQASEATSRRQTYAKTRVDLMPLASALSHYSGSRKPYYLPRSLGPLLLEHHRYDMLTRDGVRQQDNSLILVRRHHHYGPEFIKRYTDLTC